MPRAAWIAILILWGSAISGGYWQGLEYESTQSHSQASPAFWPTACALARKNPQRPTLLVFMHPKCPCTVATIRELERLLARHQDCATVYVIALRPAGAAADWERTQLVDQAAALPGAQVVIDYDEHLRRMFHVETSGECLLYDAAGQLRFHGGLTPARGHEGASQGQASLSALLNRKIDSLQQAPVFGCDLDSSEQDESLPNERTPCH